MHTAVVTLALAALFQAARADLPVHCLRHQIVGEWELVLSEPSPHRSHCGHKTPDREDAQPPQLHANDAGSSVLKVTLHEPNKATTANGEKGTWTMLYDEGWAVKFGDMSYFAFSKFDLTNNGGDKKNVSHCEETMQGWYSDEARNKFGCYTARKSVTVLLSNPPHTQTVGQHSLISPHPAPAHTEPLSREWHERIVLQLNQRAHTTWRAKVYDRWLGKSLHDINGMMGLRRLGSRSDARRLHRGDYLQRNLRAGAGANVSSFPKFHDWSSIDGANYLEPVMDQGSCGSCYAVSGVRMLTARHRIATKNPKAEPFSITYAMECSEYNQGCNGGYGFLIGKWSKDVGLVPESCAPYSVDAGCSLQKGCMASQTKRWRGANPHYVGGYYGGTTEEAMLQELYTKGPVTAGFEPKSDFMFYAGGIYQSGTDVVHHNPAVGEWERVDHGVLLTGWGVENEVKYWTLQNSWGADWGENGGYFRMKRGENDSGVESVCEAAEVVEDELNGKMVDAFAADP